MSEQINPLALSILAMTAWILAAFFTLMAVRMYDQRLIDWRSVRTGRVDFGDVLGAATFFVGSAMAWLLSILMAISVAAQLFVGQ